MARKEQVTCDVCGAQKQETNHWFIVTVLPGGEAVIAGCAFGSAGNFFADCCGEACVLKKVSELISK